MASRKEEKETILELLEKEDVKTIVLTGDAGVGKTWIAKEVTARANSKHLSYMTFWVFLNEQHETPKNLHENIARQLSLLSTTEDWEDDVSKEEEKEEEEPKEETLESLKRKISDKLEAMRSEKSNENKFLLLILDGVPDTMNEVDILRELEDALKLNGTTSYKVLITIRKEPEKEESEEMNEVAEIEGKEMKETIKIDPLSDSECLTLLKKRVTERVKGAADFETRAEEIAKKSKGIPTVILVIAEALNCIGEYDSEILTLEGALKEAALCEETPDGVNPVLCSAYDMMHRSDKTLFKCYWHSLHFFDNHGGVHYNELIAYWILEEYVGTIDRVEEAYKEGHRVLMELIDLHMLKIQDDNIVNIVVMMEGLPLPVPDCHRDGYKMTSILGLATVFKGDNWQVFRRMTQADGMMKALCKHKNQVSTLLLDGSRLSREVPDKFFEQKQQLQVLVLFSPTLKSLPSALSEMVKLRLLVLRGCDALEDIDPIKGLESLTVLEISGANSLKDISPDFFKKLSQLRSLKLSAVHVSQLPSSISDLSELCWLILRECSSLETLPKLKKLTKLQMLDLSGASKLKRFEDVTLKALVNLRILDISQTQLGRLPILGTLEDLTRLSLTGCECLPRLSKLKSLSKLKILELSGAAKLKEIPDESMQSKDGLKILDLSKTRIRDLPFNFNSLNTLELLDLSDARDLMKIENNTFEKLICLRHLNLSNTKIENLPSLSNLDNLEVLNLSGCSDLKKIGDQSFEHMTRLQHLNLSGTKIECLPSISKLVDLCQLDLCGVRLPEGADTKFLKNMNHLQLLNLSRTGLTIPSLSDLTNLTQLSLQGCSLSELEPNLEKLKKLEVLDLSETKITSLPTLTNLNSLRELKLRGCSSLQQLRGLTSLIHLELLDLWGTGIKVFPYEISELTSLKHLDLPNMKGQDLDWGRITRLPEVINWVECDIFSHCQKRPCISLQGTELFKILQENTELWEKCFAEFHFSVCPLKEQLSAGDICWHRVDPSLRNIYLKTFSLPIEYCGRFLEIIGFDSSPAGVEDALIKSEYVALIDNKFIKSLSDLAACSKTMNEGLMAMKGCMLERCTEMETIFGGEETEVIRKENLQTLRVSNLPKLNSVVSSGIVQVGGFQNLKELYLDCCPVLEVVFHSSQLPQNLQILQIKFCDALKTLFTSDPPTECKLEKLKKLHLVEMPELTSIGVPESKSVVDIFPSMESIKVRECPKINNLGEIHELPYASVENSKIEEY